MKKIVALILSAAMLVSLVVGCSRKEAGAPGSTTESPAEEEQQDSAPISENPEDYSTALSIFSSKLFAKIRETGEENPVISPLSIFMAMSMMASGAEGATLEEIESVLGMDRDTLNLASSQILDSLSEISGSTAFELANSMWADSTRVSPKEPFAENLKTSYNAELFTRELVSPAILGEINGWVSDKTHGLINSIVDEINEETVMMLINTLYLKAAWETVFFPEKNTAKEFITASGEVVETDFLVGNSQTLSYIRDGDIEGAILPYDDGRLAFVALKAADGTPIWDRLDMETFDINYYLSVAEQRAPAILSMPKFVMEYGIDLRDISEQLGLRLAFTEDADFSSIDSDIHMSSIMHKAKMRVDEEGTEAAASTAINFDVTSVQTDDILYLTFDSPYLYAIVDLDTGLPLFMGILDNPAA